MKKIKKFIKKKYKEEGEDLLLIASYSGGDDSGYFTMEYEELFSDEFELFLNNHLGYENWAGEFEAEGVIYWNGKEFIVEGWETERQNVDVEIKPFNFE